MTWVATLPPLGPSSPRWSYNVYYRTADGRTLLWHGGFTEAAAKAAAAKVLADDKKQRIYHFVSATIVETKQVETVTRHIDVEVAP